MNGHDEGREEKQRIEKDANEFMKTMEVESTTTNKLYRSIYIAGATAENNILSEQLAKAKEDFDKLHTASNLTLNELAKERELRKELVEALIYISKTLGTIKSSQDEPEALAYYEAERAIKKGT